VTLAGDFFTEMVDLSSVIWTSWGALISLVGDVVCLTGVVCQTGADWVLILISAVKLSVATGLGDLLFL
jgi:hypothetical protein